MATRRRVRGDSPTPTTTDEGIQSGKSDISPAVPSSVIAKLLGFTLAMVTIPLGSYFATVDTLFKGNSSYAGGLAALMANVVLIGYVIVAMKDDQTEQIEAREKEKAQAAKLGKAE